MNILITFTTYKRQNNIKKHSVNLLGEGIQKRFLYSKINLKYKRKLNILITFTTYKRQNKITKHSVNLLTEGIKGKNRREEKKSAKHQICMKISLTP